MSTFVQSVERENEIQTYQIHQFENNPGLYYERQGTLLRSSEKWKLVVKLNISGIQTRISQITKIREITTQLCESVQIQKENKILCENMVNEIVQKNQKIEQLYKRVKIVIGMSTRKRRGLINGVGSLAKSLFGTMDASDEQLISEHITLLEKNQATEQQALKNQLHVLNGTIAHLDDIEKIIQRNNQAITATVLRVIRTLDKQKQEQQLRDYLLVITNELTELELDVKEILELLTNVHTKIEKFEIIPIEQIIQALSEVNNQLPRGQRFPFSVSLSNWNHMKEFVKITVYCQETNILVILHVPLVTSMEYEVYSVIPLPVHVGENNFVVAKLRYKLVALDSSRQSYLTVDSGQLSSCNRVQTMYVCDNIPMAHKTQAGSPCEVQAYLTELNSIPSCKVQRVISNKTIWVKLETTRIWLYSTLGEQQVKIKCENQTEKVEVLKGSGTLKLSKQCGFSTQDVIVSAKKIITNSQVNTYLPQFNLSLMYTPEEVYENTHSVQNFKLENITQFHKQIEVIRNQVQQTKEEMGKNFYTQPHFVFPTSVSGTLLVVTLTAVVYLFVKRRKFRREYLTSVPLAEVNTVSQRAIVEPEYATVTTASRTT